MHPAEILRDFENRCHSLGLAVTHQRSVIYRELLATGEHPTPEAVYERVKEHIPSISLGTVYKNIRTFLDAGLLREVSVHHGTQRLDANVAPHYHMVCTRCRGIFDVPEEQVEAPRLKQSPATAFAVERVNVEFLGICAACAGASHS